MIHLILVWGVCGLSFFLAAQWKTQKTLSFFVSSHFFNHHFIQKNKKNLSFLSFFQGQDQKKQKKLGKTKKKQTWASDQTFSEKFCFLVFWFSRGFFDFVNRAFPKSLQILFFVGFLEVYCFFGFSRPWILSQRVVKYCFFLFPTCFDSVHSYYPQDIFKKKLTLIHICTYIYIYIYTCRDNISKCSEVNLGGVPYIYIYWIYIYNIYIYINI